jgi:hypothetical protein
MAKDTPLLQGKVAKILTEREVVINIGSAGGEEGHEVRHTGLYP